jgi:hypothetical protein
VRVPFRQPNSYQFQMPESSNAKRGMICDPVVLIPSKRSIDN